MEAFYSLWEVSSRKRKSKRGWKGKGWKGSRRVGRKEGEREVRRREGGRSILFVLRCLEFGCIPLLELQNLPKVL
jgi:hypothetical protein